MFNMNIERLLRDDHAKAADGPLAVLIVVCVLFCFIWTPMLCQRQCTNWRLQRRRQANAADEEVIRVSLRNLNLLDMSVNAAATTGRRNPLQHTDPTTGEVVGMSLTDRREFIKNVLVSKKIISISNIGPPTDDGGWDEEGAKELPNKSTLLLADVANPENTSKHVSVEPCPICFEEYQVGDLLCWSQNSRCQHCFHRDCMEEWLTKNEQCPVCRHNYLILDGDEEGQAMMPPAPPSEDLLMENAYTRGMNLFYLISRLQTLADTRPNTRIRLDGVELANGRRGSLEIQRSDQQSTDIAGWRGLNVRVASEDNDESIDRDDNELNGAELDTIAAAMGLGLSGLSDNGMEEGTVPTLTLGDVELGNIMHRRPVLEARIDRDDDSSEPEASPAEEAPVEEIDSEQEDLEEEMRGNHSA